MNKIFEFIKKLFIAIFIVLGVLYYSFALYIVLFCCYGHRMF